MARPLALGLFTCFYSSLPLKTNDHSYALTSVFLWTSTHAYLVFVSTGFGLNTFTADITEPARFSLAIIRWQLLFLLTAKFKMSVVVFTLRRLSEHRNDLDSPTPHPFLLLNQSIHHHFYRIRWQGYRHVASSCESCT